MGSSSTKSNNPGLLEVAKKRIHLQGLRDVVNNGVEGVRNITGGDHSQHHESSNPGVEEGALLESSGGISGHSFIVGLSGRRGVKQEVRKTTQRM